MSKNIIFQAFNWRLQDIKRELPTIADSLGKDVIEQLENIIDFIG